MEAYYSSDDEISWGPVTINEIRRNLTKSSNRIKKRETFGRLVCFCIFSNEIRIGWRIFNVKNSTTTIHYWVVFYMILLYLCLYIKIKSTVNMLGLNLCWYQKNLLLRRPLSNRQNLNSKLNVLRYLVKYLLLLLMEAYYSFDDEVFWGQVTINEIKRNLKLLVE